MNNHPYLSKRIATLALFFVNGFLYANWASRLPELQKYLNISHAELGTLLFVLAIGAVMAMPFTGWLSDQMGSHRVIRFMSIGLSLAIGFLAFPENPFMTAIIFYFIGAFNGAMDVTMNEQAVLVEREWKRPIMSSFHGAWSIGLAVGAGTGALYSNASVSLNWHLLSVGAIGLIGFQIAAGFIVKVEPSKEKRSAFVLPTRAIIPLGIIAFCGMLSEGALADWSAIFMNQIVGESEAFSAFAFGFFGAAMTVGRLVGDRVTYLAGKKQLMIFNSVFAILGLSLVIFVATKWVSIIGFFLCGLGLANVVPIIYTTAGNMKNVSPSMGIAMATTIGYAGFFVGPPAIGFLADQFGLRVGLGFALFLLVGMLGLVSRQKF